MLRGAQKPQRILCAREIQKSLAGSSKKLLDDIISGDPRLRRFYSSTQNKIEGLNGTEFAFAGLRTNPDNVKSMEGLDIAWVEEAANVSQMSIDTLEPTLRKPGSEIWYSWNPGFATDPVDNKFRGGEPPPDSIIIPSQPEDNPWFPEVLRLEMEWQKSRDIDKYNHIWRGGYLSRSDALVFKHWEVEDFEVPAGAVFYYGADWGFAQDPTTLVRIYVDQPARKLYIDYEAWEVGCEIDDTPALFDTVPGARKWNIRADSARPETISYMQRQGFNMTPAVKGANSVEEGVTFLQNYTIVVHPRCKRTIDELTYYSYKTDKLTGNVLPELDDSNNHIIDAARYALEEVRQRNVWAI